MHSDVLRFVAPDYTAKTTESEIVCINSLDYNFLGAHRVSIFLFLFFGKLVK